MVIRKGLKIKREKLHEKTFFSVNEEVRIIRGCGWIENYGFVKDRTCFNRAGTHQVKIYFHSGRKIFKKSLIINFLSNRFL